MDSTELRRADFKTGIVLIAFCLWFLVVTFVFMPFRETYGGVENVWYVSPWIFPAVVLTLLLLLSVVLTVNAARQRGFSDVVEFPDGRWRSFRLTPIGMLLDLLLVAGSGAGLWYLVTSIERKIEASVEEARWLANPASADLFSWSDPLAITSMAGVSLLLIGSVAVLAVAVARGSAGIPGAGALRAPGELPVRFAIIALLFCELVYLLLPNVDFFISVLLFLTVFTATFHVDQAAVVRTAIGTWVATGVFAAVLLATGDAVNSGYRQTSDLVVLAATLACTVRCWRLTADHAQARTRLRNCLLVSWLTPLILAPVFRFGLLVPLPHEGAVIELMHRLRYALY